MDNNNTESSIVSEKQSIFDTTSKSEKFFPHLLKHASKEVVYIHNDFWKYLSFFLLCLLLIFLFLWQYGLVSFNDTENTSIQSEMITTAPNLESDELGIIHEENQNTDTNLPKCISGNNTQYALIQELLQIQNSGKKFLIKSENTEDINGFFEEYKTQIQNEIDFSLLKELGKSEESIKNINSSLEEIVGKKASYLSNSESLGIEVNDANMSVIIPKDSEFPISKTKTYLTRKEFQRKMYFRIFIGEDEKTSENTFLGKYVIENLEPIKDMGPRVEVTIDIAADGKINFLAQDIFDPNNIVEAYLDTEVDIFKRGNDDRENIKEKFIELDNEINSVLLKTEFSGTHLENTNNPIVEFIRVIDGDTVVIDYNSTATSVRLIGIDAPENSRYRYGFVEEFGEESSEYLKSLISNGEVHIEFDETQGFTDTYGRPLVYLFVDNQNINQLMIKAGFAEEYTYDTEYKYSTDFKKAEAEAQKNKLGIWQ